MTSETPSPSPGAVRLHPRHRGRGPRVGPRHEGRHPLPARAQRPPPHRPRQVHLPRLRRRGRVRRPLQPPVRRHEPAQGGAGVHRRHPGRHPLAGLRLGREPVLRVATTSSSCTPGPSTSSSTARRSWTTSPPTRSARPAAPSRSPAPTRRTATDSVEENLDLFARMRAGEFPNGARVLRAKIDMAAPNINLRDPVLYRIVHASHPRTGDAWCIYPTYDYAHGQSDAIEGVTHSLCTLEFDVHRAALRLAHREPAGAVGPPPVRVRAAQPHLRRAVQAVPAEARQRRARPRLGRSPHAHARGPAPARLPRRGHPRLRPRGGRRQGQQRPRVRDAGALDPRRAEPDVPAAVRGPRPGQGGHRELPRGPGRADGGRQQPRGPVRRDAAAWRSRASCGSSATTSWRSRRPSSSGSRRGARSGCATRTSSPATSVVKDAAGRVVELRCTYDPATRGGDSPDGRRPKATLHWVSAAHAIPAEVRLYDHLFSRPDPGSDGRDLLEDLNPQSETVLHGRAPGALAGGGARRRDRAVRAAGLLLRWTRTRRPGRRCSTGR